MQVSSIVSFLKRFTSARIIFYGHFPDLLLAKHSSNLRAIYRAPFDRLEASSTAAAHLLLVNSTFTRDTFRDTFPRLRARTDIRVLYPAVAVPSEEELANDAASWESGALYKSFLLCKHFGHVRWTPWYQLHIPYTDFRKLSILTLWI